MTTVMGVSVSDLSSSISENGSRSQAEPLGRRRHDRRIVSRDREPDSALAGRASSWDDAIGSSPTSRRNCPHCAAHPLWRLPVRSRGFDPIASGQRSPRQHVRGARRAVQCGRGAPGSGLRGLALGLDPGVPRGASTFPEPSLPSVCVPLRSRGFSCIIRRRRGVGLYSKEFPSSRQLGWRAVGSKIGAEHCCGMCPDTPRNWNRHRAAN